MPDRRIVEEDGTRRNRMVNAAVALLGIIEHTKDGEETTAITSRALRGCAFTRMAEEGVSYEAPEDAPPAHGDLRAWPDAIGGHGLRLRLSTVASDKTTPRLATHPACQAGGRGFDPGDLPSCWSGVAARPGTCWAIKLSMAPRTFPLIHLPHSVSTRAMVVSCVSARRAVLALETRLALRHARSRRPKGS